MTKSQDIAPEHTAVRVALWRALHAEIDPAPHVLVDKIGEKIVAEEGWRNRPDMTPQFSKAMRASIVGRARLIEDLVDECVAKGVSQYVILGAGLDTFAQRRPETASRLSVFEVDQPGPQKWKQNRLKDLGFETPSSLHFVPVDFETGQSWWEQLCNAGFDPEKPAIVVSTGVSMYLSREANLATFRQLADLAPGSTFAMTFMLALELLQPQERSIMEFVMKKTAESGTPFISLFRPEDMQALAREAGFKEATYVSAEEIYQRYFAARTDGLRAGDAEAFLISKT